MTILANAPTYDSLAEDIEAVKQIDIVPTMLEVICRTTGMGFAAIARVTGDRWIACSVRDDISFGLKPGGELRIETTICNEIRDSHQPVIIDNVAEDENYACHHTPRLYGFQSYISFPIILRTGAFFGTLCAIDPQPAQLNNPRVIGMFRLFSELLAFHLQNVDLIDRGRVALVSDQLVQKPLRKLQTFTELLVTATETGNLEEVRQIALQLNSSACELSTMIRHLAGYST